MTVVSAETRLQLIEISGLIEVNLVHEASRRLSVLIRTLPLDEFMLASPDIRVQIDRFLKQRRRELLREVESRIAPTDSRDSSLTGSAQANAVTTMANPKRLSDRVDEMLRLLADNHIFKWTSHYRDTLHFVVASAIEELFDSGELESELTAIGEHFSNHSKDIFSRGYKFQISRGLSPDVAEVKSIGGVQSFLDLVVSIYLEQRQHISSSKKANVLWGMTSAAIAGLLRGYGSVKFRETEGWRLLSKNMRIWVPPMGFCRGSELIAFFEDFSANERAEDLQLILGATTFAIERMAHQFHGEGILLPRLSRMSVQGPIRLDITLSMKRGTSARDLLVTCFWAGSITNEQPILAAESLRAVAIVAILDERVREWVDKDPVKNVIDAAGLHTDQQQIHHLSELIYAKLESHGLSEDTDGDPKVITRNFARDFPLDDPDFRRQFMVERHSVKRLLQEFDGSVGIHLWCSVRRSGKTTAAQELAGASGKSIVVSQTMDRMPRQPIQNIFSRRLREAFEAHKELDDDFLVQVVRECTLASTASEAASGRIVFIIDEYESLFALLDAYVRNDVGLKVMVALPLLSQMVDFATQNLLIFMGQRPDAYQIFSTQSQLSPLVQQYNFPLFNHASNAPETEFTQLLSYVLGENLPFEASFASAVFEETSGHPYLTVNLMVDFCDWLIGNKFRLVGEALSAQQFTSFVRDRLTPAALKRSPHYEFFHAQMAEYLSEQARADEPWLAAIASILKVIATKHPKTFDCSFSTYEQWAAPIGKAARMTVARMLATGSQANFLKDKDGRVSAGVRILARLAASASPNIN